MWMRHFADRGYLTAWLYLHWGKISAAISDALPFDFEMCVLWRKSVGTLDDPVIKSVTHGTRAFVWGKRSRALLKYTDYKPNPRNPTHRSGPPDVSIRLTALW